MTPSAKKRRENSQTPAKMRVINMETYKKRLENIKSEADGPYTPKQIRQMHKIEKLIKKVAA
jgi:hypothetical protein